MGVWKQFFDLIIAWVRSDQIRVAPTTGRLLGLQQGDRFVLRGESYMVESRSVTNQTLVANLISSQGRCRLTVDVQQPHEIASGELADETTCMVVFDDDVTIRSDRRP